MLRIGWGKRARIDTKAVNCSFCHLYDLRNRSDIVFRQRRTFSHFLLVFAVLVIGFHTSQRAVSITLRQQVRIGNISLSFENLRPGSIPQATWKVSVPERQNYLVATKVTNLDSSPVSLKGVVISQAVKGTKPGGLIPLITGAPGDENAAPASLLFLQDKIEFLLAFPKGMTIPSGNSYEMHLPVLMAARKAEFSLDLTIGTGKVQFGAFTLDSSQLVLLCHKTTVPSATPATPRAG
jgi:hypothetical protein